MLQNRLVRTKAMFIVSILCTFPFYYGCHFVFDKKKKFSSRDGMGGNKK